MVWLVSGRRGIRGSSKWRREAFFGASFGAGRPAVGAGGVPIPDELNGAVRRETTIRVAPYVDLDSSERVGTAWPVRLSRRAREAT